MDSEHKKNIELYYSEYYLNQVAPSVYSVIMTLYALIFFLWNPDGTVDLEITPVESCPQIERIAENVSVMCVKFIIPAPGEPV